MLESSEMIFESRMVSPERTTTDVDDIEVTLRPKTLSEYIGQDMVKENLTALNFRTVPITLILTQMMILFLID